MKAHSINSKTEESRKTSKRSRSPSKKLTENASVFQEISRSRNNQTEDTSTTTPNSSNAKHKRSPDDNWYDSKSGKSKERPSLKRKKMLLL